ncbi:MAG: hypothetical protein AB7L13_18265 [Acidimicrobiia bacterium]
MAVKKLSIALDENVAERAREAAEEDGLSLSAWVSTTLDRALRIREGLAVVDEWEAEHGAFTAEELAWADEVVARASSIKPQELGF